MNSAIGRTDLISLAQTTFVSPMDKIEIKHNQVYRLLARRQRRSRFLRVVRRLLRRHH
jgi:hypothetical protein